MKKLRMLLQHNKSKFTLEILLYFFLGVIIFCSFFSGTFRYSNDSWSYFELASKFDIKNLYQFNTFRSYFDDKNSASFPFLTPFLISIVSHIFAFTPDLQKFINIFILTITILVFKKIFDTEQNSKHIYLIISFLLLSNPFYLDEVFGGRSLPLSILLLSLSYYFYLSKNYFLFGLAIGFCVLNRFDFLLASIFLIFIYVFQNNAKIKFKIIMIFGYFFAVSPWVFYSLYFFNKFWVTDNSWVALSANLNYVLDYPAISNKTLLTNPVDWLWRVISNVKPFLLNLFNYIYHLPLLILLLILIIKSKIVTSTLFFVNLFFGIIFFLSPYLLTGYFDPRYFVVSTLVLFVYLINNLEKKIKISILLMIVSFISIIYSTVTIPIYDVYKNNFFIRSDDVLIDKARQCQSDLGDVIFCFSNTFNSFSPYKYGAITKKNIAILPSNWEKLSKIEKSNFLSFIGTKGRPIIIQKNDDINNLCDDE